MMSIPIAKIVSPVFALASVCAKYFPMTSNILLAIAYSPNLASMSDRDSCWDSVSALCYRRSTQDKRDSCRAARGECDEIETKSRKDECNKKKNQKNGKNNDSQSSAWGSPQNSNQGSNWGSSQPNNQGSNWGSSQNGQQGQQGQQASCSSDQECFDRAQCDSIRKCRVHGGEAD
jgi:hypothetical protein